MLEYISFKFAVFSLAYIIVATNNFFFLITSNSCLNCYKWLFLIVFSLPNMLYQMPQLIEGGPNDFLHRTIYIPPYDLGIIRCMILIYLIGPRMPITLSFPSSFHSLSLELTNFSSAIVNLTSNWQLSIDATNSWEREKFLFLLIFNNFLLFIFLFYYLCTTTLSDFLADL